MRVAIVSDIHGNLTAFEAVLADLRRTSPDVVLHGGDLADGGASPREIVDRIRELGWQGVLGNTDQMLTTPKSLADFAKESPRLKSMFDMIEEMAAATRALLGEERLAWLRCLPRVQRFDSLALVHASPASCWHAPGPDAGNAELESVYGPLEKPICVYGHIHRSYVRSVTGMIVVNTGSVSLSYDGDPRAAYLLLDQGVPTIRRVEYQVESEMKALANFHFPHADWIARILASASPQMP